MKRILLLLAALALTKGESVMMRTLGFLTALVLLLGGVGQTRAGMITFSSTGSIQQFTAPAAGTYDITVAGAQGGNGALGNTTQGIGGDGVVLSGTITLTAGEVLKIVVGGQGGNASGLGGGGGGGGSFVYVNGPPSQPLIVAGGGGGGGIGVSLPGGSGQTGTAGQTGFVTDPGAGGTNGSGGSGGTLSIGDNGGGGAGWLGNGINGTGSNSGGGFGPPTFAGGGSSGGGGGFGGFGGGGFGGGDGGGGYSGGGGGSGFQVSPLIDSGGGGSFLDPSLTGFTMTATQTGDGSVTISSPLIVSSVPEPSSLLLLSIGGVSFAVYGWRRRKQADA